MKTLLLSFILSLLVFATAAQINPDTTAQNYKPFYLGIKATTIGYNLKYKGEPKGGDIQTYGSVNVGYKLNKRARVQLSLSYGTDKTDRGEIYVEADDKLIYYNDIARTRGISVPISFDYTVLYPFRRVELYGTVMITPILSKTHQEKSESRDGETIVTYDREASGINTYLTLGGGVRYRLNSRFDAYLNYYRFSRNFNSRLARKDEYPYPGSFELGLNYNLNLKREK